MSEQLLMKFKLPMIEDLEVVRAIVSLGYRRTENKFSVSFNGSKGYLSNIEITCEGWQKERNNIIWVDRLRTKRGTLMSKMVSIYHSEDSGVRIEVNGNERQPQSKMAHNGLKQVITDMIEDAVSTDKEGDDDLPF